MQGNRVGEYSYDANDQLKRSLQRVYNGANRLQKLLGSASQTTTYGIATQTDTRSVTSTYTYHALNRVTAATVTDGTVTYEYDNLTTGGAYAKGRLTKVTDPSGNTTYAYDQLGRVITKTQTVTASINKVFTVGYGFSSGRPSSLTYPSGRVVTYGYNGQGQVSSIAIDGTTLLSGATYDPFGPVTGWTWANGEVVSRTYDLDGRVKSVTLGPSTATYADLSQVFGYDSVNRLNTANLAAGQTQGFGYDANGNRTSATINAATTTYTYPTTSHRLTSLSGATTRSFTYDNAGNTTVTGGVTFTYDGRGRMKQAGTTTYLVNGLGQRVKKATGVVETFFAYDEAGHLIGEYDTAGAAIQETVWLGDLPVAVMKPATPTAVFYIWADNLGTPRMITNVANQSRWEWANSDPFGNNLPNENPAGLGIFTYNLRFPGQYYDGETGKHYNYYRDYDPSLGRYVESDPLGIKAGLNTFLYGIANPIFVSDPLGLEAACEGDRCNPKSLGAAGGGSGGGSGPFPDYDPPLENVYPEMLILGAVSAAGRAGAAAFGAAVGGAKRMYETCKNVRCKPPEVHDAHHTFGGRKMCHLQLNCWVRGQSGSGFAIRIPYPCDSSGPPGFRDRR